MYVHTGRRRQLLHGCMVCFTYITINWKYIVSVDVSILTMYTNNMKYAKKYIFILYIKTYMYFNYSLNEYRSYFQILK